MPDSARTSSSLYDLMTAASALLFSPYYILASLARFFSSCRMSIFSFGYDMKPSATKKSAIPCVKIALLQLKYSAIPSCSASAAADPTM